MKVVKVGPTPPAKETSRSIRAASGTLKLVGIRLTFGIFQSLWARPKSSTVNAI